MLLKLNHTQRLNPHALLGAQRADVAGVRAIWAIQDKLGLTPDEEKRINSNARSSLARIAPSGAHRLSCRKRRTNSQMRRLLA